MLMSLLQQKVEQWSTELRTLSNIAESQLHAALTHGPANGPTCPEQFLISTWLTSVPIHEFGFCLHIRKCLRGRHFLTLCAGTTHCVCGSSFTV